MYHSVDTGGIDLVCDYLHGLYSVMIGRVKGKGTKDGSADSPCSGFNSLCPRDICFSV